MNPKVHKEQWMPVLPLQKGDMFVEKLWKIGTFNFITEEEYNAGIRDLQRIKKCMGLYNLNTPENASVMYEALRLRPDFFETVIGNQFLHKLVTIVVAADVDKQRKLLDHNREYAEALQFIESEAVPFRERYKEILCVSDKIEIEGPQKRKGLIPRLRGLVRAL